MNFKHYFRVFLRYVKQPSRYVFLLKALANYRLVRNSEFFDRDWILSQYEFLRRTGANPVFSYLEGNTIPNPSPNFIGEEYRALNMNPESKMNPLVHYEREGKRRNLPISYLDAQNGGSCAAGRKHRVMTLEEYRRSLLVTESRIERKARAGEKIRVYFLVFSPSMFPAAPLARAMLSDAIFDVRIAVVPDMRFPWWDHLADMDRCESELSRNFPRDVLVRVSPDASGEWPDILADADIVCYPNPYDTSIFKYNPHWAVGRSFLPIHANYGYGVVKFAIEIYALQNFAYFWLTFTDCQYIHECYRNISILRGENSALTGYVKMDALAAVEKDVNRKRKVVIIAPHCSIAGMNSSLLISNFMRYSEFFFTLAGRFPEIDFVFRPHPVLFRGLAKPENWGERRVREYRAKIESAKNMTLNESGSYLSLFANSDGIIQDCASFLAEYCYTDKPQCYMLSSAATAEAMFLDIGRRCLDSCHLAYNESDIESFVRDVIVAGRDDKAEVRAVVRREIMLNYPDASGVALDSIKRKLGL